jgi:hypothetical protein
MTATPKFYQPTARALRIDGIIRQTWWLCSQGRLSLAEAGRRVEFLTAQRDEAIELRRPPTVTRRRAVR